MEQDEVVERHRHRYEVNQKFLPEIEKGGGGRGDVAGWEAGGVCRGAGV